MVLDSRLEKILPFNQDKQSHHAIVELEIFLCKLIDLPKKITEMNRDRLQVEKEKCMPS